MRPTTIKTTLAEHGIRSVICTDQSYAIPSKEWVLGKFSRYYKNKVFGWGLWRWKPSFDCDNFARVFASLAQVSHARSSGSGAEGLTIGEFFYDRQGYGGHAINIIFSTPTSFFFLEPQTCKEIQLSQQERLSCFFCRF
jgi:hypothetical protein